MRRVDELLAELAEAPERDILAETAVVHRAANLLRPAGALARLDRLAGWLAAWQRTDLPDVERPGLVVAVGDHGSAGRLDSASATDALVDAIRAGVSTSTVLAAELKASMRLVDARAAGPAGDVVGEDSMSAGEFEAAFREGRQAVASMDVDLLLVGAAGAETGFGAAMAAAAMDRCGGPATWIGNGEPDPARTEVFERSVRRFRGAGPVEALDAVRRLGGREMAVLAGMMVEARLRSLPTVIDGPEALVTAAAIDATRPGSLGHLVLAAPVSPDGTAAMARRLDLEPVVDLETGMGEGVGALLALPIVRLAARVVVDVTTGDEWGVR